jgi:triosephosphate isomerase
MRKWIVAGNWKMNNTIAESTVLAKAIKEGSANITGGTIILAPPFTSLQPVRDTIKGSNLFCCSKHVL